MTKKSVKKSPKSRNVPTLKAQKIPMSESRIKPVAQDVNSYWSNTAAYYAIIVCAIFYFSYSDYKSYIEKKRLEMSEVAYEVEMNFLNTLGYAESTLNQINRQIADSKLKTPEIKKILSSFNSANYSYTSIKDVLSVGTFYWVDANKHLVASSAGTISRPIDLSNRDYLESAKNDLGKIHTGSAVIGASSGQHVIPAGVAVVDSKGKYLGTSVVSFKIDSLVEKFKRLIGHYKTDFAILSDNNKVLMESELGLFSENIQLLRSLTDVDGSVTEEVVSDFSFTDRDGGFITLRNVRGYPYKILVGYKNTTLTSEIMSENFPHLIELLIITFAFAMIFLFFHDAVSRKSEY
jgi:hypothetical protein